LPLTAVEIGIGSINLAVMLLIMISQSIMLLAWLDGRRGGVSGDDEEDFAIFVIIADWLVGFGSFFGNLVILIDGGFGRYGNVLCDYNAIEIYFTRVFSVMCVMLYAVGTFGRFINREKIPFGKAFSLHR
jgi:hypothetical protein